jgi:hypothetical protein
MINKDCDEYQFWNSQMKSRLHSYYHDKQQTNMMSELEIKNQFEELQKKYQAYLPKVDPGLIHA